MVECLTRDRGAAGSSLTGVRYGLWAIHIYPSLVLVQHRKTRPYINERSLMGRKESNQANKKTSISSISNAYDSSFEPPPINTAINGPPSARQWNTFEMAFRRWADDGSTLNAGLVPLWSFRGSGPVLQRNPVFCDFSRGGGVRTPRPLLISPWCAESGSVN